MKQKSGPDKRRQTSAEGHSASDPPAVFGGRENPHRAGGIARRGEYLRALPPGGHRCLDVLRLVQRVPRGRQAPAGGRHGARSDTSGEVKDLRREASALKEAVADLTLENRLLKKV